MSIAPEHVLGAQVQHLKDQGHVYLERHVHKLESGRHFFSFYKVVLKKSTRNRLPCWRSENIFHEIDSLKKEKMFFLSRDMCSSHSSR
jgi:hypothetical protein